MPDVLPHLGVFALYVGLTASGYDLARPKPGGGVSRLIREIREADWPGSIVRYFGAARRRGKGINPYWPRAAMLVETSFHLDGVGRVTHSERLEILRAIDAFPVSRQEKDVMTTDWVMQFPEHYRLVVDTDLFPKIWSSYLKTLTPYLPEFSGIIETAYSSIANKTRCDFSDLPDLVVVPNLLQAPEIADYVRKDGYIYVVLASPQVSSVVHEVLHDVLAPILRAGRVEIVSHRHLLRPVLGAMMRMQYAWDDDDESWLRVFEENFMRAAAIWVLRDGDPEGSRIEAGSHARQGFIYVPAILECLKETDQGLMDPPRLFRRCLSRMRRTAGSAE